jgi:hypothetical protein
MLYRELLQRKREPGVPALIKINVSNNNYMDIHDKKTGFSIKNTQKVDLVNGFSPKKSCWRRLMLNGA